MKTIVLALLVGLVLIGCDSGNDNGGTVSNNISEDTIIGTWEYIYPASQCRETNIFNQDKKALNF